LESQASGGIFADGREQVVKRQKLFPSWLAARRRQPRDLEIFKLGDAFVLPYLVGHANQLIFDLDAWPSPRRECPRKAGQVRTDALSEQ